ncbi:MAG: LOG family protein [Actinomycetota bacterium]
MNTVAVFGASSPLPGDAVYDDGIRCGRLLAEAGFAVATGGYAGLMEAVSYGARQAGGRVIGVTVPDVFPDRPGGNAHLTEETRTASLLERIHEMVDLSVASIALPGSLGTATELLVAWNLAYVARFTDSPPKPIVAVGDQWRHLVPLLTDELGTDGSLVTTVDTVDEAVRAITTSLHTR